MFRSVLNFCFKRSLAHVFNGIPINLYMYMALYEIFTLC